MRAANNKGDIMKVGKILSLAAFMSGNNELSEKLDMATAGNYEFTEEESCEVKNLIECYDITVSELNDERLPLLYKETLTSSDGKFYYGTFEKTPLEIKSVYKSDIPLKFKVYPKFFTCGENECTVEYNYLVKSVKSLDEECVYDGTAITPRIIAEGVVSELYITLGMFEEALMWRDRYLGSVAKVVLKRKVEPIKPRGWF